MVSSAASRRHAMRAEAQESFGKDPASKSSVNANGGVLSSVAQRLSSKAQCKRLTSGMRRDRAHPCLCRGVRGTPRAMGNAENFA